MFPNSEVVITLIIFVIFLVVTELTIIIAFIFLIRIIVFRLKTTLRLILALRSETSLRLAHLIELCGTLIIRVVFEELVLLVLQVLILKFLDHLLLLCTTLAILQIVHVELVLQVVNIGVLFDIRAIETLKLSLKPLILLLELRLDIFNALQPLVGPLQLDTTPLDSVLQDGLITAQRLYSLLHLIHLTRLRVNDIANALFDVLLLRVLVQVATDGIEELEGFVAACAHLALSSQHVVQLGAALSDLSGQLTRCFEVVKLRARVEVHHLSVRLVVIIALCRLHRLVHHLCNLEHLLDRKTLGLI